MWRLFMSKIFTGVVLAVVCAAPAMAGYAVAAPAPEVAGGILGMTFAAGIVYLVQRRRRSRS